VCKHFGSPLLGAGSSLPFPLRRGEFRLTRRHGAGVPARGPTYVPAEPSSFKVHVLRAPSAAGLSENVPADATL